MIVFTSDLHFGHETLFEGTRKGRMPAGVETIDDHDEYLLDCINRVVLRDYRLYILGDFAWKNPGKYRQRIRCKHITFIRGNHDKTQKTINVFGHIHDYKMVKLSTGDRAFLCHYPMYQWDRSHHGTYHFYGHAHGSVERDLDHKMPDRRSLDVGVDNRYNLLGSFGVFTEGEILSVLTGREGHGRVQRGNEKYDG